MDGRTLLHYMAALVLAAAALGSAGPVHAEGGDGVTRVYLTSFPPQLPLVVDGVIYFIEPGGFVELEWEEGSVHVVEVLVDVYYAEPGVRFVFEGWNTGDTGRTVEVVARGGSMSIVAIYRVEYFVEVVSEYGSPSGTGWYPAGSIVEISVDDVIQLGPGVRAVFSGWSEGEDPRSPATRVYVYEPKRIVANWTIEYLVEVEASVSGVPVSGSGWYPAGSRVTVEAPAEVGGGDVVLRFAGWRVEEGSIDADDLSKPVITFTVDSPVRLEAVYEKYYLVEVKSPVGEVEGTGYYSVGDTAVISAPETVPAGRDARYVFKGWSGDAQGSSPRMTVKVLGPMDIVAEWKLQYKVSLDTNLPEVRGVYGEGWYDAGSRAVLRAEEVVPGRLGVRYVFVGWTGDVESPEATVTITVDSPKTLTAIYVKDYTWFYMNLASAGLIVVGLLAAYVYAPRLVRRVRS